MARIDEQLDFRIDGCALGISARRIWEHTQLRQINPFVLTTPTSAMNPQDNVIISVHC